MDGVAYTTGSHTEVSPITVYHITSWTKMVNRIERDPFLPRSYQELGEPSERRNNGGTNA